VVRSSDDDWRGGKIGLGVDWNHFQLPQKIHPLKNMENGSSEMHQ